MCSGCIEDLSACKLLKNTLTLHQFLAHILFDSHLKVISTFLTRVLLPLPVACFITTAVL